MTLILDIQGPDTTRESSITVTLKGCIPPWLLAKPVPMGSVIRSGFRFGRRDLRLTHWIRYLRERGT